ncbi:MAG: peptidoglycan DD-metalloendopeptidase family protein [Deltaproteobacteria bacterium]|nr:peptidoglycan DD-metalloendopeptidase family protein [Deltaproteobacteria bacterium]
MRAALVVLVLALAAPVPAQVTLRVLAGVAPSDSFGDAMPEQPADDLSDDVRAAIQSRLARAAAALRARGRLVQPVAAPPRFAWPLLMPEPSGFGYYGISAYVDHDPLAPGAVRDFHCGRRTYDLPSGYNHTGTDIFLWPWAWNRVESNAVQVVAAADGTIIEKDDGNPDHNCKFGNNAWNAVYVRHADGSTAWYGHLKRHSLTDKAVGDSVSVGEYLGIVGSSGNSTGPHLHFEVHDRDGRLIDPYAGTCNRTTATSWWEVQPSYLDPSISALTSGIAKPLLAACPKADKPNQQDVIVKGRRVVLTAYYRDLPAGEVAQHTIYTPAGVAYARWSVSSPQAFAAAYRGQIFERFAADGPLGAWRYQVEFAGRTYTHEFAIVASPRDVPTRTPAGQPRRTATPTPSPIPTCPGDCGGDGRVGIDELVRAVGIALDSTSLDQCAAADRNRDGRVAVDEIVAGVACAQR